MHTAMLVVNIFCISFQYVPEANLIPGAPAKDPLPGGQSPDPLPQEAHFTPTDPRGGQSPDLNLLPGKGGQ